MNYQEFLASKFIRSRPCGFEPTELNPQLKPFQRDCAAWACRRGRAELWEECGLGKTFQYLEFGRQAWRHTDKPVLVLVPLAVARQTEREAAKFGIDAPVRVIREQSEMGPGINITNYQRLHLIDTSQYATVILDESQILKNYTGKTKRLIVDSFRETPYRLGASATPAPNDRMEIGNHSEFLGVMPSDEMLARWFINDTMRAGGYVLRPYAAEDFWRWCASWAVCIGKPSDIGHDDAGYDIPPLEIVEHIIESTEAPEGHLFDPGKKVSATEVHREKRRVLKQRVGIVADLVNGNGDCWAVWCDTDYEADALRKAIPDAVEVRGSHSAETKEERLELFSTGKCRVMITKASIGGLGLNWQHCHQTIWFAGYSYEKWYQAIRRLWRFGQTQPVTCHTIMSHNEESIKQVLDRKARQQTEMQCEMAALMRSGMLEELYAHRTLKSTNASRTAAIPDWLHSKGAI
jgi:hypothetical protein